MEAGTVSISDSSLASWLGGCPTTILLFIARNESSQIILKELNDFLSVYI